LASGVGGGSIDFSYALTFFGDSAVSTWSGE
jgi:hypothetical protein